MSKTFWSSQTQTLFYWQARDTGSAGLGQSMAEQIQRIASWLSLAKCKIEMQLDKLNQQCSKLALFANTIMVG